jgi:hypothetical protein
MQGKKKKKKKSNYMIRVLLVRKNEFLKINDPSFVLICAPIIVKGHRNAYGCMKT